MLIGPMPLTFSDQFAASADAIALPLRVKCLPRLEFALDRRWTVVLRHAIMAGSTAELIMVMVPGRRVEGVVVLPLNRDFQRAVETVGQALNDFVSGDPAAFKACWLKHEHVSIFGGRGAYETGWDQVGRRLDWAFAGFVDGRVEQQVLSSGCSEDVGYTVSIERGDVTVEGQDVAAPLVLRVTHIYRLEDGSGTSFTVMLTL